MMAVQGMNGKRQVSSTKTEHVEKARSSYRLSPTLCESNGYARMAQ